MRRSGTADLPLHGGRVPAWLAERMTALGTAISEAVLYHYGTSELLTRLSDVLRLNRFVRRIEAALPGPADLPAVVDYERKVSRTLGGRTVFDDSRAGRGPGRQLELF